MITTFLTAKKAKRRTTSGGGGGGFGSTITTSNNNATTTLKTRAISGHTRGSGTKPLREAANTYDAIVKMCGTATNDDAVAVINDLYVRSPKNNPELLWFVGKLCRCVDEGQMKGTSVPTVREAALCQKRIVLEYAARELRPQNLGGPYMKDLELWTAPGNSEMDCVQNKVSLDKVVGSAKDISDGFSVKDVGYNPEIYVGDEIKEGGLRISRDQEGKPIKGQFDINEA